MVGLQEVYEWLMGSIWSGYGFVREVYSFVLEVYSLDPECTVSVQMILQLIFLLHVITIHVLQRHCSPPLDLSIRISLRNEDTLSIFSRVKNSMESTCVTCSFHPLQQNSMTTLLSYFPSNRQHHNITITWVIKYWWILITVIKCETNKNNSTYVRGWDAKLQSVTWALPLQILGPSVSNWKKTKT
jgi:hypothetical protein